MPEIKLVSNPCQQTWHLFLNLLISFFLLYSDFLLASPLFYFRCVWPDFTIYVISGSLRGTHTLFSQHSRTTALTAKLAFLTDVAGLPS